tara:strand:+ start:1440 stop:1811 length:372 start_codon:yes stop_codon:yes gene_type:complete
MKLTLNKIYDCRNFGQIDDGYPFTVAINCSGEDGAEYKGWYYVDDNWGDYLIKWEVDGKKCSRRLGDAKDNKRWNFWQSKLPNGKKCSRKIKPSIGAMMLSLIKENKDSVENFATTLDKVNSN